MNATQSKMHVMILYVIITVLVATILWQWLGEPDHDRPRDITKGIELSEVEDAIRASQLLKQQESGSGIYYVSRQIAEGLGKPAFAREEYALSFEVPRRFDRVDTYQTGENVLTLISSNKTEGAFDAYLTTEHEGEGFAPERWYFSSTTHDQTAGRLAYDEIHNLDDVYASFISPGRPDPLFLRPDAEFSDVIAETNQARFLLRVSATTSIDIYVNLDTHLVEEEIMYVKGPSGAVYEMAKIMYREYGLLSLERFDEVFNMNDFAYQSLSTE